jgi:hypothetical protein
MPTSPSAGARRLRLQRQSRGAPHRHRHPPRAAQRVGQLEHRHGPLRRPRRLAHDDVPHEPPAVAARRHAVLGQPEPAPGPDPRGPSSSRRLGASDVHVPHPRGAATDRRASRAATGPSTPGRTSATASTRTAAAPATRPRRSSRAGRELAARWRRSWSREIAPGGGQGPASARAPVRLRARARRLLPRPRPVGARRGRPPLPAPRPEPMAPAHFRDDDHWLPPATDLRASVLEHLRSEGFEDPMTGGSPWSRTRASSATSSTPRRSSCAAMRRSAAGRDRRGPQHPPRARLYTLRPAETRAAHVASMDKDHYVSPFISMDARYTVRVQDRGATCGSSSTRPSRRAAPPGLGRADTGGR